MFVLKRTYLDFDTFAGKRQEMFDRGAVDE